MPRLRRTSLRCALAVAALGAAAAPAAASAADPIHELPVSFTVRNVNHTKLACHTDGRTYTIRGHLTGTASELASPQAATLYLHGLGLGEFFWRFDYAPSYDFAAAMAAAGHVSVTIDRLGYGRSGKPQGKGSCIGGQADIAHQIIGQLTSGRYHGATHPRFARVGLVGHSAGGQIAQVEGYSFKDAAAIGVLAYADQGQSAFQLDEAAVAAKVCAKGGEHADGVGVGPTGYALLGQRISSAVRSFFSSATPGVVAAAYPQLTINPCGDLASYSAAPATDLKDLGAITVPVLDVQGARDQLFPAPSGQQQAALYTGSPSVTFSTLDASAHALTFEADHVALQQQVAAFLTTAGL